MKVTHRKHTNGEVLKQTYEMNGTGRTSITSTIQNGSASYCSQCNKKKKIRKEVGKERKEGKEREGGNQAGKQADKHTN